MKFEEFLQKVAPKVGPSSAFSLARDARIEAIEGLLIKKGVATEEEVSSAQDAQLEKVAENVLKMPPLPEK